MPAQYKLNEALCFPFRSCLMACQNFFAASRKYSPWPPRIKFFAFVTALAEVLLATCHLLRQAPPANKPRRLPSSAWHPTSPLVTTSRFWNCCPDRHTWSSDHSSWPLLPQYIHKLIHTMFYVNLQDKEPRGIIPLENLCVREVPYPRKPVRY